MVSELAALVVAPLLLAATADAAKGQSPGPTEPDVWLHRCDAMLHDCLGTAEHPDDDGVQQDTMHRVARHVLQRRTGQHLVLDEVDSRH